MRINSRLPYLYKRERLNEDHSRQKMPGQTQTGALGTQMAQATRYARFSELGLS